MLYVVCVCVCGMLYVVCVCMCVCGMLYVLCVCLSVCLYCVRCVIHNWFLLANGTIQAGDDDVLPVDDYEIEKKYEMVRKARDSVFVTHALLTSCRYLEQCT